MKELQLLGVSQDSVTVIFDVAIETRRIGLFVLYPNTNESISPYLPFKNVNFQLMSQNVCPDMNKRIFFGCATPSVKEAIFDSFDSKFGIKRNHYDSIVHPTSYIADSTIIDNGVLVEPGVIVSSQSKISFGVFLKRGSLIGHHNIIGEFADINPGVVISGKVNIGKGCIIGSGTVIKDNVTIGENSIIGIGSVVTRDIPSNSIAFGNPCRVKNKNNLE